VEYSPRYSVTLVYLPDFVDSDGCPVGVESAQHAHTCTGSDARSRCYAVLLWRAYVRAVVYVRCVVWVKTETHLIYEHTFDRTLCVLVSFVINLHKTLVCFK